MHPVLPQFQFTVFIFDISKTHFTLSGRYWSHIQAFRDLFKRIFNIFRHASFPHFPNSISRFLRFPNIIISNMIVFWTIWGILVSPKLKDNWFWESWTRPKISKSWKWWVFGLSQNEIETLLAQNEAEQFCGAFGLIFQ